MSSFGITRFSIANQLAAKNYDNCHDWVFIFVIQIITTGFTSCDNLSRLYCEEKYRIARSFRMPTYPQPNNFNLPLVAPLAKFEHGNTAFAGGKGANLGEDRPLSHGSWLSLRVQPRSPQFSFQQKQVMPLLVIFRSGFFDSLTPAACHKEQRIAEDRFHRNPPYDCVAMFWYLTNRKCSYDSADYHSTNPIPTRSTERFAQLVWGLRLPIAAPDERV